MRTPPPPRARARARVCVCVCVSVHACVCVSLCVWLSRLTLVCEVIRYRLVQVRQNQKILFGLAARKRLSLSLPLSFSPSSYFLSFSVQKMNTSCEPHVNGFYDQRPRWAGASEPRCTSSRPGLLTVGHLSPSPIGNLDPVDDRGSAGEGASSAILVEDGPVVYPANAFDSRLRGD